MWFNKGVRYVRLQNYEGALRCFERCLELSPRDAATWCRLAEVHAALGDLEAAIEDYDAALGIKEDYAAARIGKGRILIDVGGWKRALKSFDAVLGINPDNAAALAEKGVVLAHLGRLDEGYRYVERAAELNPHLGSAWYALARVLALQDERIGALAALRMAVTLSSKYSTLSRECADLEMLREMREFEAIIEPPVR